MFERVNYLQAVREVREKLWFRHRVPSHMSSVLDPLHFRGVWENVMNQVVGSLRTGQVINRPLQEKACLSWIGAGVLAVWICAVKMELSSKFCLRSVYSCAKS